MNVLGTSEKLESLNRSFNYCGCGYVLKLSNIYTSSSVFKIALVIFFSGSMGTLVVSLCEKCHWNLKIGTIKLVQDLGSMDLLNNILIRENKMSFFSFVSSVSSINVS